MAIKTKLKPKKSLRIIIYVIATILVVTLGIYLFYLYERSTLTSLGYSIKASDKILFSFKKSYVLDIGKNKTLNAAFESSHYNEKYLDNYSKIKYFPHKDLISNINALIKKKYTNQEISMILAHGNNEDVKKFSKRDKIDYLEEFYTYDYAKIRNYDRYLAYMNETGEDEENTIIHVNLNLDQPAYENPVITDDYSTKVLVNKHRRLKENYKPKNLITIPEEYVKSDEKLQCDRTAFAYFKKMASDAKKEGLDIVINSAYRSYEDQEEVYNEYKDLYGDSYVLKYVSNPGFSEHQTGLGLDLASKNSLSFSSTKEYEWAVNNSYKYGFIHRYPKSAETVTGFTNESWHFRYVGKEIATYMFEHKLVYEEYFAMFLDKD